MFCTKCGSEISDGNKFCTKCGAKLSVPEIKITNEILESVTKETDVEKRKGFPMGVAIALIFVALAIVTIVGVTAWKIASSDEYSVKDIADSVIDDKSDAGENKDDSNDNSSFFGGSSADNSAQSGNGATEFEYELPDSIPDESFTVKTYDVDGEEVELLVSLDYREESSSYSDSVFTPIIMTLRNKSDKPINYNGNIGGYDASGNELNMTFFSFPAVGPGETRADGLCLNDTSGVAELKIFDEYCSFEEGNKAAYKDLEYETALANGNIILRVVNNTDCEVSGAPEIVYYDENDKPYDWQEVLLFKLLPNSENVQKVEKKSGYKKAILFPNFVSYEYANNNEYLDPSQSVTYRGFSYSDAYGTNWYYFLVKNISSECINMDVNFAARNSDGILQDAEDAYISNLAPNEEIMYPFTFSADSSDWDVQTIFAINDKGDINQASGTTHASIDTSEGDGIVKVRCTNNGSEKCSKIAVRLMYFDKDDNLVGTEATSYHLEIAPGESVEDEVAAPTEYDHFESYFSLY